MTELLVAHPGQSASPLADDAPLRFACAAAGLDFDAMALARRVVIGMRDEPRLWIDAWSGGASDPIKLHVVRLTDDQWARLTEMVS